MGFARTPKLVQSGMCIASGHCPGAPIQCWVAFRHSPAAGLLFLVVVATTFVKQQIVTVRTVTPCQLVCSAYTFLRSFAASTSPPPSVSYLRSVIELHLGQAHQPARSVPGSHAARM